MKALHVPHRALAVAEAKAEGAEVMAFALKASLQGLTNQELGDALSKIASGIRLLADAIEAPRNDGLSPEEMEEATR